MTWRLQVGQLPALLTPDSEPHTRLTGRSWPTARSDNTPARPRRASRIAGELGSPLQRRANADLNYSEAGGRGRPLAVPLLLSTCAAWSRHFPFPLLLTRSRRDDGRRDKCRVTKESILWQKEGKNAHTRWPLSRALPPSHSRLLSSPFLPLLFHVHGFCSFLFYLYKNSNSK